MLQTCCRPVYISLPRADRYLILKNKLSRFSLAANRLLRHICWNVFAGVINIIFKYSDTRSYAEKSVRFVWLAAIIVFQAAVLTYIAVSRRIKFRIRKRFFFKLHIVCFWNRVGRFVMFYTYVNNNHYTWRSIWVLRFSTQSPVSLIHIIDLIII